MLKVQKEFMKTLYTLLNEFLDEAYTLRSLENYEQIHAVTIKTDTHIYQFHYDYQDASLELRWIKIIERSKNVQ